ncbi:MAG: biotin transporter BioY, partial [Enterobacteriaceae bacterium]
MIKETISTENESSGGLTRYLTRYKEYGLILTGVLLLFVMSQISIPLQPVPVTLQTVAVMLIGLTWQRAAAIKTVSVYLLLGAMGMPLFADFSAGYGVFMGPTGGYLAGFLLAVWVMTSAGSRLNYQRFFPA